MDFFINAFNIILYRPLFNALVFLYEYLPGHDFGVAVIVLTIIIRVILYPLMVKSIKSQKALSDLQPKIQEIQNKYKNEKEKQAKEMMVLYQKEKINPFGGCLPLLLQLPILIALFRVFQQGLQPESMVHLYSFMPDPGTINQTFLGIVDLAMPSLGLAFLAGITQFFQSKMIIPQQKKFSAGQTSKTKTPDFSQIMQKQMLYFFPIFTVFILWRLPAAIGIYWIITALFSIGQQYLIFKPQNKNQLETKKRN